MQPLTVDRVGFRPKRCVQFAPHEERVASALEAAGWTITRFGRELFDPAFSELLNRTHPEHRARAWPDFLAIREDDVGNDETEVTVIVVDAKSRKDRYANSPNRTIAVAALDMMLRLADDISTRAWFVWENLTATPADWIADRLHEFEGPFPGTNSRTEWVRLSKSKTWALELDGIFPHMRSGIDPH